MHKYLIVLLLMGACKLPQAVKTVTKDSIVINTVFVPRDTTVFVPGQTITLVDTLPCPDASKSGKSTAGKITASYTLNKGLLSVHCETDSLTLKIHWLERELQMWRNHTEYKEVPIKVKEPVPFVPKWMLWLLAISIGLNIWYNRNPLITIVKHLITKW